ncbi:hypothetical protein EW146_g5516 [Bondarzewia mesenterica]|uniref:Uncharacterized protein n=1 Tax=Bondarzewia mesenterica TaxID=1095465 RepID=A0A4S4LT48_9AGAM|nr:hypothetical protein EW146_g5516 [Bondarzewia mesenterica]
MIWISDSEDRGQRQGFHDLLRSRAAEELFQTLHHGAAASLARATTAAEGGSGRAQDGAPEVVVEDVGVARVLVLAEEEEGVGSGGGGGGEEGVGVGGGDAGHDVGAGTVDERETQWEDGDEDEGEERGEMLLRRSCWEDDLHI